MKTEPEIVTDAAAASEPSGSQQRVVVPPKFDDTPEWIPEVMSLIGIGLLCWFDWRLGIGLMLTFGRIYRYVVLSTRRHNGELCHSPSTTKK